MQQETMTPNTIFTYIGFNRATEGADDAYWIYDPRTNKHHEVSKEKYDEVMKNATDNF